MNRDSKRSLSLQVVNPFPVFLPILPHRPLPRPCQTPSRPGCVRFLLVPRAIQARRVPEQLQRRGGRNGPVNFAIGPATASLQPSSVGG